jgi:hypothetical protein
MNVRGFLLGSAAALTAVTGARAADAVVVAEPEPVEYVRVCDVYGTGYFYIPGTETCLRVGGYVRYQASGGDLWERTNFHDDTPFGGEDRTDETYSQYSRLALQTWTGTETELGTLQTFTETRFEWADGGGTDVTLNFAWIQLGGLRVGKDESAFSVFLNYAGGVIADDIIPYGPFDTNLISYTFTGGNGFAAIVALESGTTDSYGHDYDIVDYMPHVVVGAKFVQGWGGIGIVGGYDSIHETWSTMTRLDINATDKLSLFLMAGYGDDDDDFNFYKPWGGEWAVFGGLTAGVSDKAKVNLQLSYDDSEQVGAALNVAYELVPGFTITPEVDYYDAGNGGDDAFGGILRFERSF